jgi:peptide/nickel transport system permease protein
MTIFIVRRTLQSLFVITVISIIVFMGVFAIGNPVDILIHPEADQIVRENAIKALGLDKPLYEQYFVFVGNALSGDLGLSFATGEPVMQMILHRLPATLELATMAVCIAIFIGIPLGMWAGLRPDGISGRTITCASIAGFSLPSFWQGMMLVLVFSVTLRWLPSSGRGEIGTFLGISSSIFTLGGFLHIILPSINLAVFKTSIMIRLARAGVLEIYNLDYIKFAKAKGLRQRRIVGVHILKNIMIPIITVLGMELGSVIAFAVVTESIFAWPGMGKLIIDSIYNLDRPVIVGYLMCISMMFIGINLVVDILYSVFDPRVRLSEAK